eukprot:300839-Rhodomonas_salina.5
MTLRTARQLRKREHFRVRAVAEGKSSCVTSSCELWIPSPLLREKNGAKTSARQRIDGNPKN